MDQFNESRAPSADAEPHAPSFAVVEQSVARIPIASIRVDPGHNPRRHVTTSKKFQELLATIKADGLIQAILVRPDPDVEDSYLVVAGESRLQACTLLGYTEIDAAIRHDCTTREHAKRLAVLENAQRHDLSYGEQALAARDLLDANGGDAAATCSALRWSEKTLKSRLALLHCATEVLDALALEQIVLGHAELLAGLPIENQLKALPRIIEQKVDVATLREQLQGFSIPLAKACFDTAGCRGCPHNSETQQSLFETALAGANCLNKTCFGDKTTAALEAKRTALRESLATVVLVTERDSGTYTPLVKTGTAGVGDAQFATGCKGCVHFGAVIENRLNGQTGTVQQPVCFNLACNREKVAAYQASLAPSTHDGDDDDDTDATNPTAGSGTTSAPTRSATKPKTKAKKPSAVAAAVPKLVAEHVERVYCRAAASLVKADNAAVLALAVYGLAVATHADRAGRVRKLLDVRQSEDAALIAKLAAFDAGKLIEWLALLAEEAVATRPDHETQLTGFRVVATAHALTTTKGIELAPHVRIDREFLDAHTKSAIETLLVESGFKAWREAQPDGAKAYRALVGGKKEDLIAAVLGAGFDFAGYVPSEVKHYKLARR